MRVKKRLPALLLACVMVLALLPVSAFAASPSLSLKIDSAGGTKYTATLSMTGNPGICSAMFTVCYDKTKCKCTNITVGKIISGMMYAANESADKGAIVAAASASPATGDGVLATYSFTSLDGKAPVLTLADVSFDDSSSNSVSVSKAEIITNGTSEEVSVSGDKATSTSKTVKTEDTTLSFSDTAGHPHEKDINRAAELGLFSGYKDGSFKPDKKVSRAQFITVFYRLAGSPEVTTKTPFTDISGINAEFRKAIAWGYEQGYIHGKTDTTFDPSGTVTKQQAAAILYRMDGESPGMEMMFYSLYDSEFSDSSGISKYAKPAMYWAYYNGILDAPDEALVPKNKESRADLSVMLVRYLDDYKE